MTNVRVLYSMNCAARGRKFVDGVMTRSTVKGPLMPAAITPGGMKFKEGEFHVGLLRKVMINLRDTGCVSVNHAELSRKRLRDGIQR